MFNAFTKVALLGRPNVGKSTLFNRLIRSNRAITHDRPGVTRDRMEGIVQPQRGDKFTLIDTGGVTLESESRVTQGPEELHGFEEALLIQAQEAVGEAALLCFVVDGRDGLTPFDSHLADFLRKQNKPLLLVVNKVDGPEKADLLMAEFHQLGFDMIPVSASHGYNVRELEKEIAKRLEAIARDEVLLQLGGQAAEPKGKEGDGFGKKKYGIDEQDIVLPAHMQGATKRQKKRLMAELMTELVAEQKAAKGQGLSDGPNGAEHDGPEYDEPKSDGLTSDELTSDGLTFGGPGVGEASTGEVSDSETVDENDRPNEGHSEEAGPEEIGSEETGANEVLPNEVRPNEVRTDGSRYGQAADAEISPEDAIPLDETTIEVAGNQEEAAPDQTLPFYTADGPLRLALLGRPNVGKSSLVNAMVGEQRMIVSNIAGTTRDSVDVSVEVGGEPCIFVDTAGVRRRAKITDTVERYSVNSSLKSTTKAHVTLLMLDVSEGLTAQDKRLIELLNERKTPFMVLVNKIDLLASDTRQQVEKDIKGALIFCEHVPVLFISVLKKRNLKRIVPLAKKIREECGTRVTTGQLNKGMTQVLEKHQPPIVKGARAKFFYLTQAESAPPTFVFFVNSAERVLPSYGRYLEKSLRKLFGIQYAPVRLHFRSSHTKKKRKK